jgi:Excalibur calcium-binding domain
MIIRRTILLALVILAPSQLQAQTCGTKTYCREMESCTEARYFLKQCGLTRLDGDNDGAPCENLCGDGGNRSPAKLPPLEKSLKSQDHTCGSKTKCNQMTSCEEAHFYLSQCGVGRLDRDGDGMPCESICK